MSRLKLIFLIFIIAILAVVFVQNREPLALKLFCPDRSESCFYQTRNLPLAIWMALFILAGMFTSLLSHVFNRYRYAGYGRPRPNSNDFESDRQWSMRNESDRYSISSNEIQDSNVRDRYTSSSYEIPQKPESVERSGSTYSYKYRDAREESPNGFPKDNNVRKNSIDSQIDSNIDRDKDDEDWI